MLTLFTKAFQKSFFEGSLIFLIGRLTMKKIEKNEKGSIELIVLGLLAALIVVLAIPLLANVGAEVNNDLTSIRDNMYAY